MTVKTNGINDISLRYKSPEIKVIEVKAQHVLCGSLGGSPSSNDWNGGSDSSYGFGDNDE